MPVSGRCDRPPCPARSWGCTLAPHHTPPSFHQGSYRRCMAARTAVIEPHVPSFPQVGDVIYIEANSGAVKRVGRCDAYATEFDLEAEEYVPLPKVRARDRGEERDGGRMEEGCTYAPPSPVHPKGSHPHVPAPPPPRATCTRRGTHHAPHPPRAPQRLTDACAHVSPRATCTRRRRWCRT